MVKYTEEHIHCRYNATGQTAIFKRLHVKKGGAVPSMAAESNVLLYIVSGTLQIAKSGFDVEVIGSNRLLFLSRNVPFNARALDDLDLCACLLPLQFTLCTRYDLLELKQYVANLKGGLKPSLGMFPQVEVNAKLNLFFSCLFSYMDEGATCKHLQELKRQELITLLRYYYTKEELYALFSPLVGHDTTFREFVHRRYKEVHDITEFASLANMTVRTFQRKFSEEFGCPARDWLVARRAEAILYELRTTDRSLMDIAITYGFSTMSYFTHFCKRQLGMTPTQIRGRNIAQAGEYPCFDGAELQCGSNERGRCLASINLQYEKQ